MCRVVCGLIGCTVAERRRERHVSSEGRTSEGRKSIEPLTVTGVTHDEAAAADETRPDSLI